jgi:SAM-dependent MidA family methyltransferase
MERALYGDGGFYRRGERPTAHFRTSVHASDRFAAALAGLLTTVDAALDRPDPLDLVDIGAGSGELLPRILDWLPHRLAARVRAHAVEVAPRPPELPARIGWHPDPPTEVTGLIVANEWLDNVPLDMIELTHDGPRLVLVDPETGAERLGPLPSPEDRRWLDDWWPLRDVGDRAEVGRPRCRRWAETVLRLRGGLALAIDYGHERADRPTVGTLCGYRDGHVVPPIPDGSCDVTAHVALDACAVAGTEAGATGTLLTTQRAGLSALGLTAARPSLDLARSAPQEYVRALCTAGEDAELIDPAGLGGFGWLVQTVGIPVPEVLTGRRTWPTRDRHV